MRFRYLSNLWAGIRFLLVIILLQIDRIGNALCGGDHRATVSGRVGYFAQTKNNTYWLALEWLINKTFEPIDGPDHCAAAMRWERFNGYRRGNDVALVLLSVVVFVACAIIAPILYCFGSVFK